MQLFANPQRQDHMDNCAAFRGLMARFPEIVFYLPSPEKAPWHVQCQIGDDSPAVLNFWPHTGKAQREYCPSVVGWAAAETLIQEALAEAENSDDFDVIEA